MQRVLLKMQQKLQQSKTDDVLEIDLLNQGYIRVIGIDEAGRGSWAGPLAVASYEYDLNDELLTQVTDSKLINEDKRLDIYRKLDSKRFFIVYATVAEIDKLNIYQATIVKIKEIIQRYNNKHTFFLIDGKFNIDFGTNTLQVVKGDLKHYSIAAASIVAKVSRDKVMIEFAKTYPAYCFAKNKGYGTNSHQQALKQNGLCDLHRKSFAPIKEIIDNVKQC